MADNMLRMAIIGGRDAVLAFRSVGVDVFPAATPEEAAHNVRQCVEESYAVVFITEDLAEAIEDTLARYRKQPFPAIVSLPGNRPTGYGMRGLRANAEKAIGADILFDKEEK